MAIHTYSKGLTVSHSCNFSCDWMAATTAYIVYPQVMNLYRFISFSFLMKIECSGLAGLLPKARARCELQQQIAAETHSIERCSHLCTTDQNLQMKTRCY